MTSLRRLLLLLATATLTAACSDLLEPEPGLKLTLEALPASVDYDIVDDIPVIRCEMAAKLTADGKGRADVTSGIFRIYAGPARSEPLDTLVVPGTDLSQVQVSRSIREGYAKEIAMWAYYPLPFELEFGLYYSVSGKARDVSVRMPCGPALPSAPVAAPTLQPLQYDASRQLTPGQSFSVTLRGTSGYGIWATRFIASGPFRLEQQYLEGGTKTDFERVWTFTVPYDAEPNVPLVLTAFAVDGLGQQTPIEEHTTRSVVDVTAPVLHSAQFFPNTPGTQLGLGDTFSAKLQFTEAVGLAWVVAELNGATPARDSVAVPQFTDSLVTFTIGANWSGATQVALHLVDRAGLRSAEIISSPTGQIEFFPTATRERVARSFTAGSGVPAYDIRRERFYIPDAPNHRLQVLDAATMTILAPIATPGAWPTGVGISASGDTLVTTAGSGAIAVIDLRGATPAVTIVPIRAPGGTLAPDASAFDVQQGSDGQWYVVGERLPASALLARVDLVTGELSTAVPGGPGATAPILLPTPDRTRLAILKPSCPLVYDIASGNASPCGDEMWTSEGMPMTMVAPDGNAFATGWQLRDGSLKLRDPQLEIPWNWTQLGYSADGQYYWMTDHRNMLTRIRASDHRRMDRQVLGWLASNMWTSPDGSYLFVLSRSRDWMARFDVR